MILQSEKVVLYIETVNKVLSNPAAEQYMQQYRAFYTKVGKQLGAPGMVESLELAAKEKELQEMKFTFNREVTLEEAVEAVTSRLKELNEERDNDDVSSGEG